MHACLQQSLAVLGGPGRLRPNTTPYHNGAPTGLGGRARQHSHRETLKVPPQHHLRQPTTHHTTASAHPPAGAGRPGSPPPGKQVPPQHHLRQPTTHTKTAAAPTGWGGWARQSSTSESLKLSTSGCMPWEVQGWCSTLCTARRVEGSAAVEGAGRSLVLSGGGTGVVQHAVRGQVRGRVCGRSQRAGGKLVLSGRKPETGVERGACVVQ